ncbi:18962_t:CDS:2, partial [Dentiscutata erythropus]
KTAYKACRTYKSKEPMAFSNRGPAIALIPAIMNSPLFLALCNTKSEYFPPTRLPIAYPTARARNNNPIDEGVDEQKVSGTKNRIKGKMKPPYIAKIRNIQCQLRI